MCLKPSFSKAPLVSGAAMEEGDDSEYEDGDGDDDDDDEGMDIDTNCVVVNNEGRKKEEIRHKASASNVQCMTWEIVGSQDEHS